MSEPLTQAERDALVRRLRELDLKMNPEDDSPPPKGRAYHRLEEAYDVALAEYADRLPRVVMGVSPFTNEPLKRSFDPFGLDGPWWFRDRTFDVEEPKAPEQFRVLLGALALHGRTPSETTDVITPGPEVPFVVPRLIGLGTTAVIHRLSLATGDHAYAISYWSQADIAPEELHQPWLRQEMWVDDGEGGQSWMIANDAWDFELAPWIAEGKLLWTEPDDTSMKLRGREKGDRCPYLDLPGDRQPQSLAAGERELLDLPDGTPLNPFED
jgi:hypothetical protein